MKKTIIAITAVLILSTASHASTTKGGYGACITESLFDEFISALNNRDQHALDYLLNNGCIVTKAGLRVSILDRIWTGKAKVRIYLGDASIVVWTNIENIVN